jgi:hypothetical protein
MSFRTIVGAGTLAAFVAAAMVACGGGGGGDASAGDGSLRMALTDAPACGYDHVWVTIDKVSVHTSATAAESDAGWKDLTLSPARRVDLLSLTNGVLEELGTMPLASGSYQQIRLVLSANSATNATANAVQPTGGAVIPLDTPSAQQSGLKLQAHFDVAAGQMADVVLDFDACKSIVKAGNSGKYNLKPVVAVVPRIVSGITGYVATTMPLASTTVAAQQNGATVRSTTPDATGKFSIPYLATGTYTVVITADGRATGVVTSVPTGTATTVISGTSTAIVTPASTMANVTGTVVVSTVSGSTTVSAPVTDATVSATQALTGGPTIALGSKPVDATAATYSFSLPQAAPVKAPYAATGALTFTADTAVAGKYGMQAQAPNRALLSKPADVSAGGATVNFSY